MTLMPVPEPSNLQLLAAHAVAIGVLLSIFSFGVLSRTYLFPLPLNLSPLEQIAGSLITGAFVIGLYVRSAFPAMTQANHGILLDSTIMSAYALILGMLASEGSDRIFLLVASAIKTMKHIIAQGGK
jgi:hypothetical protein